MKSHKGSCHCGAVVYTAEAEIASGLACNCSHCSRKGLLLTFIPKTQFTLEKGEDNLTLYQFNKKHISHLFCKTCGVQGFSFAKNQEGQDTVAININCLEDVDVDTLEIHPYNGKDV